MNWSIQSGWTDERVERLKALWIDGISASQIARDLGGITRNAVIGKIHRLGLPGRAQASAPRRVSTLRDYRRGGAGAVEKARSIAPVQKAERDRPHAAKTLGLTRLAPTPPAAKGKILDASAARLWTTRQFGECAYPVDGEGAETRSCCLPTGGATYCAGHRKIMFAAPLTAAQQAHLANMRAAKAMKRAA